MKTITIEMNLPEDVYLTLQSAGLDKERLRERARQDLALRLYAEHILSIGKAARVAGMCLADFMSLLVLNDIPVVEYGEEDYERDLATIRRFVEREKSE